MNTTNLPYLPTEIWDKIYDVKEAMEEEEEQGHKSKMRPVFSDIKELFGEGSLAYLPSETECMSCQQQCCEMSTSMYNYGSFALDMTKHGICQDCVGIHWEQHLDGGEGIEYGETGHDESYQEFLDMYLDTMY